MGLSAAQFVTITDKAAAGYLKFLGTFASGLGNGDSSLALTSDWGDSKAAREMLNICQGLLGSDGNPDYTLTGPLSRAASDRQKASSVRNSVFLGREKTFLTAVSRVCAAAGLGTTVTGIDSFASYYNIGAGGPYAALMAPDFRSLYTLIYGVPPTVTNVYPHAIANMAQQTAGGAFAAGTAVDATSYAGAARLQAIVPSYTGAGGVITVTGTARTATGTTVSGRTWAATIPTNGNTTLTLTPTVAGDLALSISAISLPAGVTAGIVVVISCAIPAGRVDPPA